MSRISAANRAPLADAYEAAARIAAEYIRAGVKTEQAITEHGLPLTRTNRNWGHFIAGLACKMSANRLRDAGVVG